MAEIMAQPEEAPSPEQVLEMGHALMTHFAVEASPFTDSAAYREGLIATDPRYKGGKDLTRQQIGAEGYTQDDVDIIARTADSMGMLRNSSPMPAVSSELTVALGGANQANLTRTEWAAAGLAPGSRLVVVGSSRKISDAEAQNAHNYAPSAVAGTEEFDLCAAAAERAHEAHPDLQVDVAYVGDEKAGTPHTIDRALKLYASENEGQFPTSVTASTNQMYALSTSMDLQRIAGQYGITDVHVAGCPSTEAAMAQRKPETYHSEILRTLRAALDAYEASAAIAS